MALPSFHEDSFHQNDFHDRNRPGNVAGSRARSAAALFPALLELTGFVGVIAVIVAGFARGVAPHEQGPMLVLLAMSIALVMLGQRRG